MTTLAEPWQDLPTRSTPMTLTTVTLCPMQRKDDPLIHGGSFACAHPVQRQLSSCTDGAGLVLVNLHSELTSLHHKMVRSTYPSGSMSLHLMLSSTADVRLQPPADRRKSATSCQIRTRTQLAKRLADMNVDVAVLCLWLLDPLPVVLDRLTTVALCPMQRKDDPLIHGGSFACAHPVQRQLSSCTDGAGLVLANLHSELTSLHHKMVRSTYPSGSMSLHLMLSSTADVRLQPPADRRKSATSCQIRTRTQLAKRLADMNVDVAVLRCAGNSTPRKTRSARRGALLANHGNLVSSGRSQMRLLARPQWTRKLVQPKQLSKVAAWHLCGHPSTLPLNGQEDTAVSAQVRQEAMPLDSLSPGLGPAQKVRPFPLSEIFRRRLQPSSAKRMAVGYAPRVRRFQSKEAGALFLKLPLKACDISLLTTEQLPGRICPQESVRGTGSKAPVTLLCEVGPTVQAVELILDHHADLCSVPFLAQPTHAAPLH